jgi:hypothetical protein
MAFVTVTVSAVSDIPTGNVSLAVDGGAAVVHALDATGKAVFTLTGLSTGTHTLNATYSAQGGFALARRVARLQ